MYSLTEKGCITKNSLNLLQQARVIPSGEINSESSVSERTNRRALVKKNKF